MYDVPRYSMGDALTQAYDAAIAAWRQEHAPSTPGAEVFSGPLRAATINAAAFPEGKLNVTITCTGRRRQEDDSYFFRYRRVSSTAYEFSGGTLDL